MTKRELITRYYKLVDEFCTDKDHYAQILHPELLQKEYPNLISPKGQERTLDLCLKGIQTGRQILIAQNNEIQNIVDNETHAVVESLWTGKMATNSGGLQKGQELKAHVCCVFEFKDNLIFRQRNYDCYERF